MRTEKTDVAIIGAGPGGSSTAIFLRRRGISPVVLEKEQFPRFHIGESLLPYNTELFDELGIHEEIKRRFMHKHGAEFVSACGEQVRKFYFRNTMEAGPPMAYQVLRSEFDHMLLTHARGEGADVRERSTVAEVADTGQGWDIDVTPADAEPYRLQARILVDASGQNTFLASRLRLKQIDPEHRRYAVFGHFHGVQRSPGPDGGNILIVPFGEGHWFWFIPLADDITSIGAVVTKETVREHRDDLQGYLMKVLAATPAIHSRMAAAKLAWPVHTLSDFSYTCSQFAGDRYVLVGDAAAFLDPVFSSGVHVAMSSGKLAAQAIDGALRGGNTARAAFAAYEAAQRDTIKKYFRLIRAYYKPEYLHMFMNPSFKLKLQPAITMLLAGKTRNRFAVRWRIELFYLIGKLLRFLPEHHRHSEACSHGCLVHAKVS